MTLIRDLDTIKSQTFAVTTDIKVNYSIDCPVICSLISPTPTGYVFLNVSTVTADATLTTQADVGSKTVKIECDSMNYPSLVTNKIF